jgi:hypothetical protein
MSRADEVMVAALAYLDEWFEDATARCELGEVGRHGVVTVVLRRDGRAAHVDVTRLAAEEARYPGRLAARIARLADRELRNEATTG